MEEFRSRVRKLMYALGAIPLVLILLRFLLFLFGADYTGGIVKLIYDAGGLFVIPFKGLVVDVVRGSAGVEFTAIVAIVAWIGIIIVITELVTSFMYERLGEIMVNLIDVLFKFVEFFLLVRLLSRFFGIKSGANELLDVIYAIAGVVYEPFSGIAPGIQVGSSGILELSTLIALIIVGVVDYVSDGILTNLIAKSRRESKTAVPDPIQQINVYVPENQPQITINQVPATRSDHQIAVRLKNYQSKPGN